jgi:hypothetical protein
MSSDTVISSDHIRSILDDLIKQRREMRAASADQGLLEANRLGIVYWQWQLSRSLQDDRAHTDAAA